MQIAACLFVTIIMMVALVGIAQSRPETQVAEANVSVKDALLRNTEETKEVVKDADAEHVDATTTEQSTEKAVTEKVIAEVIQPAVEVVLEQNDSSDDKKGDFEEKCIANVDETLNIRKEPNAEADFAGSMNPGAIAIVLGTDGDWTKIKSGDVEGYVLSDYVLTGEVAEHFAEKYVTLCGTVLEDGVNIRAEESTEADIVTVVNKDDKVTVLDMEETSEDDEITWLNVRLEDGQEGYVSAELLEIDELYEIAVSAEELQRRAEEEAARKAAEEAAARQAASQSSYSSGANTGSTTSDTSYQGAKTTPITATESGECIGTFTITAYCGCSKCSGGNSKTATGTTPTEGRTIAADTSILPYGSQVVIGGVVYTVEDTGSGICGNHIDIFFATHKAAMAFGRKTMKVYKY